ncbi:MAG: hypothetical protein H6600_02720 [Flavobacteriales bacterium]|nr:hypothetical protein [Flavobacteriales bacterium]
MSYKAMKMKKVILSVFVLLNVLVSAQDDENWDFDESGGSEGSSVGPAFYDTRVINSQSTEVLEKGTWDLRIAHRFGDMAVANAYKTMFGFDNSSDIKIGIDYAITDQLLVGIHRHKGAGPYSQLFEGMAKFKIFGQEDGKPVSLTIASSAFVTGMDSSSDTTSITHFSKSAHRFSYFTQAIVARNFNDHLSLQLNAGVLHRNLVYSDDVNTAFSIGAVAKVKLAKKLSLIAEYNHLFRPTKTINGTEFVDPLGVGIEIKTFAHVFQINLTNSRGMGEAQYIPYTASKWSKGEFRLGFTISRHF